ncbi:hypothetical protein [Burkholderia cenocepacia]|uniref:hypothetical protein n=1 Tax=Burkholderia cenocepacia TaxID=95486 RepID=UPI0007614031|nr:hypothetical protein [Burkholderia cenocepacia]KWU26381.1 hypothetical protein AS149_25670 [Burkholderia cenocepacia]
MNQPQMVVDPITKITKIIPREDGSEVRIVATAFFSAGLHCSVGVDVFRRESQQHQWKLCGDRPHPDWRNMSVDEYVRHGRPERLQYVSHGEILSVASVVGKPLSAETTQH